MNIYLDGWFKYHLNIGIDYIIIAEDCDSIIHKDITEKYNNVILYNIFEFFDLNPDMIDKQEELIKIADDIINKNKEKN
jgi:hypothetical protein